MKRCILFCGVSLLLFVQVPWGAPDVIKSEVMDRRIPLWDSERVQTEDGELRLAAYKDWVYLEKGNSGIYKKLVPGICPQWIPRYRRKRESWFYLFLPVGFDSKSELWIGSTDGYYLGKAAEGYFQVNSTPVLSPNGKLIVSVFRPLARASGRRTSISVIRLKPVGNGRLSTQEWIYRAVSVQIQDLRFEDNDTVSFKFKRTGSDKVETKKISLKPRQSSPSAGKAPPGK